MGWGQIDIGSAEVFERSQGLKDNTRAGLGVCYLLGDVLANETDRYFGWQFDESGVCPEGCTRIGGMCMKDKAGLDRVPHEEI